MDFATQDTKKLAATGIDLDLLDIVSRKPTGAFVTIIGRDSDEYKQWTYERTNARAAAEEKARRRRRGVPTAPRAEDLYESFIEEAVFCIRGWGEKDEDGNVTKKTVTVDGQELEFNKSNVEGFVRRFDSALEQIMEGVSNRALFTPTSATN